MLFIADIAAQPGESSGNVYVIANEMFDEKRCWTKKCDGGNGSNGKNWTKDEFEKYFTSYLCVLSSDEQMMRDMM